MKVVAPAIPADIFTLRHSSYHESEAKQLGAVHYYTVASLDVFQKQVLGDFRNLVALLNL